MRNVTKTPAELAHQQRQALKLSSGSWNPEHHPELAQGGAAHVERIRSEPDERFDDAIRRNLH